MGEARSRGFATHVAGRRRRLRWHVVRREHLAAGGCHSGAVHLDGGISGADSRTGPRARAAQHALYQVQLSGAIGHCGTGGARWQGMIAIVGGTGPEGSGLALRWVRAGESVIIGSRDAERAKATAAQIAEKVGPLGSVEGAENAPAVKMSDICLLYTSPSPRDRTRSRMP